MQRFRGGLVFKAHRLLYWQVTIKAGYSMPSWFDFNSLDIHNINEDAASLQHSVSYLEGLVQVRSLARR